MAQAALKSGDDKRAAALSETLMNPRGDLDDEPNQAAIENLLQARYNLLLKNDQTPAREWCENNLALEKKLQRPSPQARYIGGLCEWQLYGKRDEWHQLAIEEDHGVAVSSLAARLATGRLTVEEVALFAQWHDKNEVPLLLADAQLGSATAKEKLNQLMGIVQAQKTRAAWWKLFNRSIDRPSQKPLNK